MRKLGLIAATAVASISVVGVAQAIDVNQSLTVKTTGLKGTATKPRPIKLDVTTGTTAKDASKDGTYGTKSVVVYFDKNLRFNAAKFPTCSKVTVAKAPQNCRTGSKVGSGSARAVAGPGGGTKANPDIEAYNGLKTDLKVSERSGALGVVHLKLTNEPVANATLTGTLRRATGKYGYKLVVPIPQAVREPVNNFFVTINYFNTVISSKTYNGNAYAASTGCTGGRYAFKGVFVLTDNTTDTVTTTSRC